MRTKTLLLTAALTAAGVATSMAQAVYSVNAVGYVNVTVNKNPNSASTLLLLANPLNTGGNTAAEVLPTVPDFTLLYNFNNTTGLYDSPATYLGGWDVPTQAFPPGGGGFLVFDNSVIGSSVTVTFVGEVPEGAPLATSIAGAGRLSVLSSKAPISGALDPDPNGLNFPAADFDLVYTWNKATWAYNSPSTYLGAWDVTPSIAPAEAFVLLTDPATLARTWNKNFDVTP